MESGRLVNSNLSRSDGSQAPLPDRARTRLRRSNGRRHGLSCSMAADRADPPRLLYGLRARAFDRHEVSPEVRGFKGDTGSQATGRMRAAGGCNRRRALCRSLARNRYLNRSSSWHTNKNEGFRRRIGAYLVRHVPILRRGQSLQATVAPTTVRSRQYARFGFPCLPVSDGAAY